MNNKISGIAKLVLAASLSTALYGCVIHVGGGHGEDWGSQTSILGDIEIAEGRSVGDLTSGKWRYSIVQACLCGKH